MPNNQPKKRSNIQSGYAINVANFESIIIILNNLDAIYNPSHPLIKLPALKSKLTAAKASIAAR